MKSAETTFRGKPTSSLADTRNISSLQIIFTMMSIARKSHIHVRYFNIIRGIRMLWTLYIELNLYHFKRSIANDDFELGYCSIFHGSKINWEKIIVIVLTSYYFYLNIDTWFSFCHEKESYWVYYLQNAIVYSLFEIIEKWVFTDYFGMV